MFVAMRKVTGVHITEYLGMIFSRFFGFVSNQSREMAINNKRKIETMSVAARKKSPLYRYYTFINEILLDMNWKQKGVTVEGLTATVFIGTCMVSLIGTVTISIFLVPIIAAMTFVLLISVLFLISRVGHRRRKKLLIATEDLLCSSISVGLVQCIQNNFKQIPRELQPEFRKFLDQYTVQTMLIEKAINNLNLNLGSKFDDFCDKAIAFEKSGANKGMQDSFRYNIEQNSFISELDMLNEVACSDMNIDFFASCAVIVGYVAFTITSVPFVGEFYASTMGGKIMLLIYMMCLGAGFIFTQYLQSKEFVFEGRL